MDPATSDVLIGLIHMLIGLLWLVEGGCLQINIKGSSKFNLLQLDQPNVCAALIINLTVVTLVV